MTDVTTALPSPVDEDDEARKAALKAIYTIAQDAGYQLKNETVKLAEFVSPTGAVLYVEKTGVSLNRINCCVHPHYARESLMSMDGVLTVSTEHRFHSNMVRFPKRLHRGETPTAYGWKVNVESLLALRRFLDAFARRAP